MLSWLFKKRGGASAPAATPAAPSTAARKTRAGTPSTPSAVDPAAGSTRPPEASRSEWDARLLAAQGDDAALLRLALGAPQWQVKLAAVQAIAGEDTLKQAERGLRHHDSRVHGAARQRLQAEAARRSGAVRAQALIETAAALALERPLPLNHLVALDRDWSALDVQHLAPAQAERFAELREQIDRALREQDQARQQLQQQAAAAALQQHAAAEARALAQVQVDAQRNAIDLAANPVADEAPGDTTVGDAAATGAAPDDATHLDAAAQDAAPADAVAAEPPVQATARRPAARRADAAQLLALDGLLQQAEAAAEGGQTGELQQRLQAIDAALQALDGATLDGARRGRCQALQAEWTRLKGWQRWGGGRARDELVAEAEALARLTLVATAKVPASAPAEAAQPTTAQPLADARGVDEVADTAEVAEVADGVDAVDAVDAAAVAAGSDTGGVAAAAELVDAPASAVAATVAEAPPPGRRQATPKLSLKAHGEAIQSLRQRWKELDRLGAAASQTLWRRFDAALQTAHLPVAAHLAALQAERQANLAARVALLDALDALAPGAPAPADGGLGAATDPDAAQPEAPEAPDAPRAPDGSDGRGDTALLKEHLRALDRFHTAWRQLGPLEHTVPAQARHALLQRLRRSVERIDAPLQAARRAAEAAREALIVRAQALLQAPGRPSPGGPPALRDSTARVRELQAEWQQQARSLPLARAVEGALWARFKAATDAVFAQREAAFNARDAELAAHLAACEALLERLASLAAEATEAELQRALVDADRAWRETGELPRAAAGAIEARFRDARAALLQRLSVAAQRDWQDQCDTLAERLALCEAREDGLADGDDLARRWAALGTLPAPWERALAARWSQSSGPGPLTDTAFDELLLELEAAHDLPATPAQQAARRNLKLRALKHALEGRGAPSSTPAAPAAPAAAADLLATALRQGGQPAAQRVRLHRLVAALRQSPPGALGSQQRHPAAGSTASRGRA